MWATKKNSNAKLSSEAELSAVFQQMGMKPDHHVRFGDEALVTSKDNNVIIQKVGNDNLAVHLGFLQMGHRYHISIYLTTEMCPCGPLLSPSPGEASLSQYFNPNCHLLAMNQCDDGRWQLKVEYFAHKEKLMREDLFLFSTDENHNINLKLTFHARVLGKGKGTPLLRNGIHSIGFELEDEGETSDWQGFD